MVKWLVKENLDKHNDTHVCTTVNGVPKYDANHGHLNLEVGSVLKTTLKVRCALLNKPDRFIKVSYLVADTESAEPCLVKLDIEKKTGGGS